MKFLVSVYGTLREGQGNNLLLCGSEYVGTSALNNFVMYDLGGCPAISSSWGKRVIIETYRINKEHLEMLDILEGYKGKNSPFNLYERVKVGTNFGKSFIYVMEDASSRMFNPIIIESGDWVSYTKRRKDEYYRLTKEDREENNKRG